MYRRPVQCSPLLRSNSDAGWVTRRSSAIEGVDERADVFSGSLVVEVEVLKDRVAVGAGGRCVQHRLYELILAEAEVGGHPWQAVPPEARVDLARKRLVAVQEAREEASGAGQLAVPRGLRKQVVDRVQDL